MESKTTHKKWITLLLSAVMSVALLFGATACNDNNNGDKDIIIEGDSPDMVVPDIDSDTDGLTPSPSAS